jgi:hypothetical protein
VRSDLSAGNMYVACAVATSDKEDVNDLLKALKEAALSTNPEFSK